MLPPAAAAAAAVNRAWTGLLRLGRYFPKHITGLAETDPVPSLIVYA